MQKSDQWTVVGEVDPAELGSYKSTPIAKIDSPAQAELDLTSPSELSPGNDWQLVGVVGGDDNDLEEVRKAGNIYGTLSGLNAERAQYGLAPITEADLPDRSGFLGRARELAGGIGEAIADRFPEDMARMWRGGDVSLEADSWADRTIEENRRDRAMRLPSRQYAAGDITAKSLREGPASSVSSLVSGLGGAGLGGAAGSVVPGVGTAAGSVVGGATLSGAAFYRMAKDQFVEQVRDQARSLNVNLSPQQWKQIKTDIDDAATKYGLWEAGPEALSNAFTIGLFGKAGGAVLSRVPGFKFITSKLAKGAVGTVAKLAAEVGEEELTEGLTYYGQAGLEKEAGLRQTGPSVDEFVREQAGPVAVGSLLQGGAFAGYEHLAHGRQQPVQSTEQPQAEQVQPEQIQAQEQPQPQSLPANPAPFATASELGFEPERGDFAGTPTQPVPTYEQELSGFRQGVRGDVDLALRQGRESYQRNVREMGIDELRQEIERQRSGLDSVPALPAGQGFELVDQGRRRDLPVPSQAIQLPAGMTIESIDDANPFTEDDLRMAFPEQRMPQVVDRRQNLARRKRIDEMTPEEMRGELLTDPLTGLGNRRAWEEAQKGPVQTSLDVDSLKYVNDTLGHEVGDRLLQHVGQALNNSGIEAFHVSGDEFMAHAKTQQDIDMGMQSAYNWLAANPMKVTLPDGRQTTYVPGFSYGTGQSIQEAERGLQQHKAAREARGERSGRGDVPPGLRGQLARGEQSGDWGPYSDQASASRVSNPADQRAQQTGRASGRPDQSAQSRLSERLAETSLLEKRELSRDEIAAVAAEIGATDANIEAALAQSAKDAAAADEIIDSIFGPANLTEEEGQVTRDARDALLDRNDRLLGFIRSLKGIQPGQLVRDHGAGTMRDLQARHGFGIVSEAGFPLDQVAQSIRENFREFGIEDGNDLVQALLDMPSKKEIRDRFRFSFARSGRQRGISKPDVLSAVQALQDAAVNALPMDVVQSVSDLPNHIQQAYYSQGGGAVEAVYDPRTAKTYFVADGIASPERATALWMHEQGLHVGLRGLFANDQQFANILDLVAASMPRKSMREIMDLYGLEANKDGRLVAAEEYLARIAEKVQAGDALTLQEKRWWQKVLDAFKRLLNRAFGQRRPVLSEADMADIVMDAVRWTLTGKPTGMAEAAYQRARSGGARFSLGNDAADWGRQIDDMLAGKLHPRAILTVGETPNVLRMLGAPALPMTMPQSKVRKVIELKHSIPVEQVKALPEKLAAPLMVFDSATMANGLVAFTDMMHEGKPIIAAIHLNLASGNVQVNEVASLYDKDGFGGWLRAQLIHNRLRYLDKKKTSAWLRHMSGLQLPGVPQLRNVSKGRIFTEADLVKFEGKQIEGGARFALKKQMPLWEGTPHLGRSNEQRTPSVDLGQRGILDPSREGAQSLRRPGATPSAISGQDGYDADRTRDRAGLQLPGEMDQADIVKENIGPDEDEGKGGARFALARTGDPDTDAILDSFGRRDTGLVQRARDWWKEISAEGFAELQQGLFDGFHAFKVLDRKFSESFDPQAGDESSAYIHARLSTSLGDTMRAILLHGAPVRRNGAVTVDGINKGLLKILEPLGADLDLFLGYRVGVRANKLMAEGRENHFTREQIDKLMALRPKDQQQRALWDKTWREFDAYRKKVLDFAESEGVIDPEGRKVWEDSDHIPFYRVAEDMVKGPGNKRGLANQNSGIRTLKGGTENIGDPLANIVQNLTHLVDASIKNHAAALAMRKAEAIGMARKAPNQFELRKASGAQMAAALRKIMGDRDAVWSLDEAQREALANLYLPTAPKGKNVVHVLEGGKRVYYEVQDDLLLRSLTALHQQPIGGALMSMSRMMKRWLTAGVTADPAFMAANLMRDTLSTWAITKGKFVPVVDSAKGVIKAWKQDEDMIRLQAAGGSFGAGYVFGHDPEATAKLLKAEMQKHKIAPESVLDTPAKVLGFLRLGWDYWQRVGSAGENATRVAKFANVQKEGKGLLRAAYEAKDLMDFSMRGDWQAIQFLVQIVPFLGARIQGLHKLARGAAENPKGFAVKGGLLAAASLLLYLWNRDDDRFKELEEWDRDNYYHFWLGDQHFRLPKPFEVGAIFSTIPERLTEYFLDEAKGQGDEKLLADRLRFMLSETLAIGWPQILGPALEQWANKDSFTGRPIVGLGLERLQPGEQRDPWTSETATVLGRALDLSPKRIEHLITGYTGTVGGYILGIADLFTRRLADFPEPPTTAVEQMPVIRRFYRGSTSGVYTKYTTKMYELIKEADELVATVNYYKKTGEIKKAVELVRAERKKLVYRPYLNKVQTLLRTVNAEMRRTWSRRDIGPDKKREIIETLAKKRNQIIQRTYERIAPSFQ